MKINDIFRFALNRAVVVTFLLVGLIFSTVGSAQAKKLNGAELKLFLAGNSFSFSGPASGIVKFSTGSRVGYTLTTGQSAKGKWWIKGNRYCTKYPKRKANCYSVTTGSYGSYKATGGYTLKPR